MSKTIGWIRTVAMTDPVEASAVVRGERCRGTRDLFAEWSRALGFGPHFGDNWDAFADSLTEVALLRPEHSLGRPTTILVEEAGQLLADEPARQWLLLLGAVGDASTVRDDDEDAGYYRDGAARLVLTLRDSPDRLRPLADLLTALGYEPGAGPGPAT